MAKELIRCEGRLCGLKNRCARYKCTVGVWGRDAHKWMWVEEMYDVITASCEMFVDREELAEVQK